MHQIKVIDFLHLCLQFLHSQIRSVGYILERREGIDIKGKGIMDTYFLNGVSNDFDPVVTSASQTTMRQRLNVPN